MEFERRAIAVDTPFETREVDGKKYIEGYFAVFGGIYPLWDDAAETIDVGAFHLDRDTDVRALINHDTTLVVGRTTAGTLELSVDGRGLYGRIEINENDQDALNAYARVERRDVTQCSFGFDILDQYVEQSGGKTTWHLRDVRLYEISICTFPAYNETAIVARKAEIDEIAKRKSDAWKTETMRKLKGD